MSVARKYLSVRVGCKFEYEMDWPTSAVLQVEPRPDGRHLILQEKLDCDVASAACAPNTEEAWPAFRAYRDLYGNICSRIVLPPGRATLRYDAVVEVSAAPDPVVPQAAQVPLAQLPDEVLVYTMPSRYCLSDELSETAWRQFGHIPAGWGRVQAICDWVHEHIRFQYGSSTPRTTALDVYRSGVGVCRDFAHLAVTFCRAMSIPARYAFGYLPDIAVPPPDEPMDFCAWFEAYLDGRWYTFDPRINIPRIGRVVIGYGRDALDVAMVTCFGAPRLLDMKVWADEVAARALQPPVAERLRVGA